VGREPDSARLLEALEGLTVFLHERLKSLLGTAVIKQVELAEKLGVKPATVSQWLSGAEPCGRPYLARIVEDCVPGVREDQVRELALLNLLLDLDEVRRDHQSTKKGQKWTETARSLAEEALGAAIGGYDRPAPGRAASGKRSLMDFPEAFYPLAVVTGDKRETSESRINLADFGATSASPAESRWIFKSGLRRDVQIYSDKWFVMEPEERLKARFSKMNLLIVGSPASNHLARRCLLAHAPAGWRRAVPVFRFNLPQGILRQIEGLLGELAGLNAKQLVGRTGDPKTERSLKVWHHSLFSGGILDPSYHNLWTRGVETGPSRDFGLLSLARNPFSAEGDEYVCIMASGLHMFGTAHALAMLAEPSEFKRRPLGGVIRVGMDLEKPFAVRFDDSHCEWDKGCEYEIDEVIHGLDLLKKQKKKEEESQKKPGDDELSHVHISTVEMEECQAFIESL
jgi:hypothetical protein